MALSTIFSEQSKVTEKKDYIKTLLDYLATHLYATLQNRA